MLVRMASSSRDVPPAVPSPTAIRRLTRDLQRLKEEPIDGIEATPLDENILEWHYVIRGTEGTPFEGGIYHGKLVFSPDFPWKPPAIYMHTPNGRFVPNVRLCLSISDYHPESWNPGWTVSAILVGLHSFMNEHAFATGCEQSTDAMKRELATKSKAFNLRCNKFVKLFPSIVSELQAAGVQPATDEMVAARPATSSWRAALREGREEQLAAILGVHPPFGRDARDAGEPRAAARAARYQAARARAERAAAPLPFPAPPVYDVPPIPPFPAYRMPNPLPIPGLIPPPPPAAPYVPGGGGQRRFVDDLLGFALAAGRVDADGPLAAAPRPPPAVPGMAQVEEALARHRARRRADFNDMMAARRQQRMAARFVDPVLPDDLMYDNPHAVAVAPQPRADNGRRHADANMEQLEVVDVVDIQPPEDDSYRAAVARGQRPRPDDRPLPADRPDRDLDDDDDDEPQNKRSPVDVVTLD